MKQLRKLVSRDKRETGILIDTLEKYSEEETGADTPERKNAVLIGKADRDRQESAYGYDDEIPDL